MTASKNAMPPSSIDPDDAPELTDAQLLEADVYEGDKFIRRGGRPKGSGTKELVSLRIDRAVLDYFRAGGPGWQTRINDALHSTLDQNQLRLRSRRTVRRVVGSNARLVEEVLEASAPRALRPTEIRSAIQRDKGVAVAFTSIRHALGQLAERHVAEEVQNAWRYQRADSGKATSGKR